MKCYACGKLGEYLGHSKGMVADRWQATSPAIARLLMAARSTPLERHATDAVKPAISPATVPKPKSTAMALPPPLHLLQALLWSNRLSLPPLSLRR